jgi:hypothetical protein
MSVKHFIITDIESMECAVKDWNKRTCLGENVVKEKEYRSAMLSFVSTFLPGVFWVTNELEDVWKKSKI